MTTVQVSQTFEQKVRDRVREQIGELLSDEDLSKIVQAGLKDAFFEPRRVDGDRYGATKEPLIHEIIRPLLEKRVREQVDAWFEANKTEIGVTVSRLLEMGVGNAVIQAIGYRFNAPLANAFQDFIKGVGFKDQYGNTPSVNLGNPWT